MSCTCKLIVQKKTKKKKGQIPFSSRTRETETGRERQTNQPTKMKTRIVNTLSLGISSSDETLEQNKNQVHRFTNAPLTCADGASAYPNFSVKKKKKSANFSVKKNNQQILV